MSSPSPSHASPSSSAAPPSPRRRRFIVDPRFAIGVALVIASVLGVLTLVSAAGASVEVLAARDTLTAGEHVGAGDLVPTSVRAGTDERLYLRAADLPSDGLVATRTIGAGELVPRSALGRATGDDLTTVVVAVTTVPPDSVQSGARVDVWAAAARDDSSFDAPTVLVSGAVVVRLIEQKGFVTTSAGPSVELLVPRSDVAALLEAIANQAAISVVPVDLPLGD